jgi:small subunit ribosomal protein S2
MHKRIKKLKGMKEKRENGEYDSYTKKEQVLIDREIARLDRFFGGIANYEAMPSALFVVDTHREETAIKEAKMVGIPVVGMVDTNADPDLIDYVIPVNDDAVRSIKLVVSHIAQAYAEGKALAQKGGKTKIDAKVQQQEARAEEKPKEVSKAVKKVKNLEKKEKPVSMEKNKKPKVVRKAASPSKKAEKKTNTKSAGSKGGKRKKKVSAKKK